MQRKSRSCLKTRMQVCLVLCSTSNYSYPWTAKSQLTKANQTKTKMENLARELQKVRLPRSMSYTTAHPLLRTIKDFG